MAFHPFFFRPARRNGKDSMKALLPLFSRPSHYLGTEINSVHKDPATVRAHVALAFPDLYEVAMSYLGQKILYDIVNACEDFYAERVFAPTEDVAAVLRLHDAPLATMESDTALKDLDAVLFSITHELCYTNVLYMLDLGGIALRADRRRDGDPLVIAGGGCTFNAEPLAAFVDVMVLGDGEEILPEMLALMAQGKDEGWGRIELIRRLAGVPGVYVPSLFDQHEFTPHRWPNMPWAMEIGDMHGAGVLMLFGDGSVRTYSEVYEKILKSGSYRKLNQPQAP